MRNDRFYERRHFSKKKTNENSKKNSFLNSSQNYQRSYGIDNLLSDVGNQDIQHFFKTSFVQAKLNISQPNDIYELEADRIAKNIVNTKTSTTPIVSSVQAKSGANKLSLSGNAESNIKSLKGKGNPINKSVKEYFEPRFGVDLGNVRVHTDSNANQLAKSINAKAFTFNNDIVFGQGQYQPGTTSGKELMAHELTHTLQQGGGLQRDVVQRLPVSRTDEYAFWVKELEQKCNMQVLGIKTTNLNAPLHYEYLIKGNKWGWKTLLYYLNQIDMPSLFTILVQPFLKAAVDPNYALGFENVTPVYGDNYILPDNLKLSDSDKTAFLLALFDEDYAPMIDWNTWHNGGYWDESIQAYNDFIAKHLYLINDTLMSHCQEHLDKNSLYYEPIFKNSKPDTIRTYIAYGMAEIEKGLLQYCLAKMKNLEANRAGRTDKQLDEQENLGEQMIRMAGVLIATGRKAYADNKKKYEEMVSFYSGLVKDIAKMGISMIPIVKAFPPLSLAINKALDVTNSEFIKFIVSVAFPSLTSPVFVENQFNRYIEKLESEGIIDNIVDDFAYGRVSTWFDMKA